MKNLAYGKVGSCYAYVCSRVPPTDAEWDGYLDFIEANLEPGVHPQSVVVTDGGGPTPAQRKKLNDLIARHSRSVKVAVMTGSPVARGIVTALSWYNPIYRAFGPADLDGALAFLGVFGPSALEMKRLLFSLRREVSAA